MENVKNLFSKGNNQTQGQGYQQHPIQQQPHGNRQNFNMRNQQGQNFNQLHNRSNMGLQLNNRNTQGVFNMFNRQRPPQYQQSNFTHQNMNQYPPMQNEIPYQNPNNYPVQNDISMSDEVSMNGNQEIYQPQNGFNNYSENELNKIQRNFKRFNDNRAKSTSNPRNDANTMSYNEGYQMMNPYNERPQQKGRSQHEQGNIDNWYDNQKRMKDLVPSKEKVPYNKQNVVNKNEYYTRQNVQRNNTYHPHKLDNNNRQRQNRKNSTIEQYSDEDNEGNINEQEKHFVPKKKVSFQRKEKQMEEPHQNQPKGRLKKRKSSKERVDNNNQRKNKSRSQSSSSYHSNNSKNNNKQEDKIKIDAKALLEFKKKHNIEEEEDSKKKISPVRKTNIDPSVKALLTEMCSKEESIEREEQNLLSIFELDPKLTYFNESTSTWVKKANLNYTIKAFERSGGDLKRIEATFIRTPSTLKKTMDYIMNEIIDSDNIPNAKFSTMAPITFSEICLFVIDRFKAIRKDFTIIEDIGKECIESNEEMARFLIICLNQTLDIKQITGEQGLYNLNMTQLNSTLTSLFEFYEKNKKMSNGYNSPYQEEFISYFLLLALKQKPIEFISILSRVDKDIRKGKQIKLVLDISKAILSKEWRKFMKILKSNECSYLTSCMMVIFFNEIRFIAMNELCSYSKVKDSRYLVSINKLCEMLPFENGKECLKFIDWFGIDYNEDVEENFDFIFPLYKNSDYASENYNFINAPMMTNKTYVEKKRNNKTRKEIMLGNKDSIINNIFDLSQDKNKEETKQKESTKDNNNNKGLFQSTSLFTPMESTKEKTQLTSINTSLFKDANMNDNSLGKINTSFTHMNSSMIMGKEEVSTLFPDKGKEDDKDNEPSISLSDEDYPEEKVPSFVSILHVIEDNLLIHFKSYFFMCLSLIKERSKLRENAREQFLRRKKMLVFAELKKNATNSRMNKQYMKELIKYNMNISSFDAQEKKFLSSSNNTIPNLSFYSYEELKFFLIDKYMKEHPTKDEEQDLINYLQVNFYTTKEILVNTNIIQTLYVDISISEISKEEVIIYESNIILNNVKFSLYFRFILIDQIDSLDEYLFVNQNNLKKFSYGIICFDLYEQEILNKLITLMDISLGNVIKKKLIFFFLYKNSISDLEIDSLHDNYIKLYSKYELEQNDQNKIFYIGNLSNFSIYYHTMLKYHNNKTFVELFKDTISFESFDRNQVTYSLKEHNSNIKYNYYINKIQKDFDFQKYNVNCQQLFLGICLTKIIAHYYYKIFANLANKLYNIPSFISNERISNIESICLRLCDLFVDFSNISLFDLYSEIEEENIDLISLFELFERSLINILFNKEDTFNLYKEQINLIDYEIKTDYFYNRPSSSINCIYLPVVFFSKLIDLISAVCDICVDTNFSFEIMNKVLDKYEVIYFEELEDLLHDLIKHLNNKHSHTDLIREVLSEKKGIDLMKRYSTASKLLSIKRKRDFDDDYVQKEKQLSLQYIAKSQFLSDNKSNEFFRYEESSTNNKLNEFHPHIVKYKFI